MNSSSPAPPRYLVVGSGYVGTVLARRLARSGAHVFAARRHPAPADHGVVSWILDLADPSMEVPDAITHLAFCAAPDEGTEESYRRIYVDGLRRVLAAVTRQGGALTRVVFTSSTSVFSEHAGGLVDEDSATEEGESQKGLLRQAEQMTEGTPGGVVARLAGIYGPGRERLVRMVAEGTARCAEPAPIGNRIHRDDAAAAIDHLLHLPAPSSRYLVVDDAPVPLCEVYRWIADQLGVPPPPTSSEPDPRGRGAFKRCSNARLLASGFRLQYPTYREGYGEILRQRAAGASTSGSSG